MDDNDHYDISSRNKEHATGNWRQSHPGYKVPKNLAGLCSHSSALWQIELVSRETGYLFEEISKKDI